MKQFSKPWNKKQKQKNKKKALQLLARKESKVRKKTYKIIIAF